MDNTRRGGSDKGDSKIKPFQYAHFRIPLYKHPGVGLFQIFGPLWFLAFVNIIIFFQGNNLGGKMAAIATIVVAFIAFVPSVNAAIPRTPYIKLIDILVYHQVVAPGLTIIDSLITARTQPTNFIFVWSNSGWFIATIIIEIIVAFVVIVLFAIHKLYWERVYTAPR